MKIVFHGDRNSKTISVGRLLKKLLPRHIEVSLWDGYKSRIYTK